MIQDIIIDSEKYTFESFPHLWRTNCYVTFPKDHWIVEEERISEELSHIIYDIAGDNLHFITDYTAGFHIKETDKECLTIMKTTIKAINKYFETKYP